MPTILRDLPFFPNPTLLSIPGGPTISILNNQIIVWVSVTRPDLAEPSPYVRRFPAVLDTGYNRGFMTRQQQLLEWAGLAPTELYQVSSQRSEQRRIPTHDAIVWLHCNQAGKRDEFTEAAPFGLQLDEGIAVWPSSLPGARRLPLLGMEALRLAGLQLHIDFLKCRVSLRTPRRWWWSN